MTVIPRLTHNSMKEYDLIRGFRVKRVMTVIYFLCVFVSLCFSQEKEQNLTYRTTLFGAGTYDVYDTYLSPLNYSGWGLRIMDEQMKMTKMLEGNISIQQITSLDFSSTKNPAETAKEYSLFLDYSYGLHYRFKPLSNLNVFAGTQVNATLGAIYNSRNGNNPVSAKLGTTLNFSAIGSYQFRVKSQPFTFRYQLDMPFAGILFSPRYGESYYEISLGNDEDIFHLTSFGNQFVMKNYLTLEIPFNSFTLRLTYLNNLYNTDVSNLQTKITSNTWMIGLSKEIFSISGKKQTKGNYRRVFEY